jgi:hypothetical protein
LNNPLLVLNTDSEQKARKAHAQVVNLIINHPRSQWEKFYSAIKEFSNSNEILKDKNYKENIKRKQKLNNIDKLQFIRRKWGHGVLFFLSILVEETTFYWKEVTK